MDRKSDLGALQLVSVGRQTDGDKAELGADSMIHEFRFWPEDEPRAIVVDALRENATNEVDTLAVRHVETRSPTQSDIKTRPNGRPNAIKRLKMK